MKYLTILSTGHILPTGELYINKIVIILYGYKRVNCTFWDLEIMIIKFGELLII